MKKILVVLSVILMGCAEHNIITEANLPIENIYSWFIRNNPNWDKNDIIYQEKMEDFKRMIDVTLQEDNIICGIPFEIEGMNRNAQLETTVVHLGSWMANKYILDYRGGISSVNVDVFAEIDDDMVAKLDDSRKYRLYGKFITRAETGGEIMFFYGAKPLSIYSPLVKISRDISDRNVNLGVLFFKADSLVPVSSNNARSKIITTMKCGKVVGRDTIDIFARPSTKAGN